MLGKPPHGSIAFTGDGPAVRLCQSALHHPMSSRMHHRSHFPSHDAASSGPSLRNMTLARCSPMQQTRRKARWRLFDVNHLHSRNAWDRAGRAVPYSHGICRERAPAGTCRSIKKKKKQKKKKMKIRQSGRKSSTGCLVLDLPSAKRHRRSANPCGRRMSVLQHGAA